MDYLNTQLHSRKINEEQLSEMRQGWGLFSSKETGRLMKCWRMFSSRRGFLGKKKRMSTKDNLGCENVSGFKSLPSTETSEKGVLIRLFTSSVFATLLCRWAPEANVTAGAREWGCGSDARVGGSLICKITARAQGLGKCPATVPLIRNSPGGSCGSVQEEGTTG